MIADLEGYIDWRAAEVAAPQIAAADARRRDKIAELEAMNQRLEDLTDELRRRVRQDQLWDAHKDIVSLMDIAAPGDPLVRAITYRRGSTIERVRRRCSGRDRKPAQRIDNGLFGGRPDVSC